MSNEPILICGIDGIDFYSENGTPLNENQVLNTVLFLLFTGSDNDHIDVFLDNKNYRFRGNYVSTVKKPITMQMLSDLGSAVASDLKPLVDDGIISDLISKSKNPSGKHIETEISFIYYGKKLSKTIVFTGSEISMV